MLARQLKPTYSPFEKINELLSDPGLTPSECKVAIGMVTACGNVGRIFYSVRKFALRISLSESRVRHILCDLVKRGYLQRIERPRLANEWVIPAAQEQHGMAESADQYARDDIPILKNSLKEKNVINVIENFQDQNVKPKTPTSNQPKISSTGKPFDMGLVYAIEQAVGSQKDRACWITVVRKVDASTIHMAISSLQIKLTEGIVSNRAAYIVKVITNHVPHVFTKPNRSVSQLPPPERTIIPIEKPTAPQEPDPVLLSTPEERKAFAAQQIQAVMVQRGWANLVAKPESWKEVIQNEKDFSI